MELLLLLDSLIREKKQYQKKSRRGPVVEILHFHFRGSRFDSWLGNTYMKKKKSLP